MPGLARSARLARRAEDRSEGREGEVVAAGADSRGLEPLSRPGPTTHPTACRARPRPPQTQKAFPHTRSHLFFLITSEIYVKPLTMI